MILNEDPDYEKQSLDSTSVTTRLNIEVRESNITVK